MAYSCRSIIDNYLNGNLTEAKRIAKRIAWPNLYAALRNDYGRGEVEATRITDYLKGRTTFQAACDAAQPTTKK